MSDIKITYSEDDETIPVLPIDTASALAVATESRTSSSQAAAAAADSASLAATSAAAAAASATNAATQASSVQTFANQASNSATNAAGSSANAASSAGVAANSATNASNSAVAASASALLASYNDAEPTATNGFSSTLVPWTPNGSCTLTLNAPGATFTSTNTDPYITASGLSFSGSRFTHVIVRVKRISGTDNSGQELFWQTSTRGTDSASIFNLPVGGRQTLAIGVETDLVYDMRSPTSGTDWITSTISAIRLDPVQLSSNSLTILSIRVVGPDAAGAQKAAAASATSASAALASQNAAGSSATAAAALVAGLTATINATMDARIATLFAALPTTMPSTPGALWNNGGTISVVMP